MQKFENSTDIVALSVEQIDAVAGAKLFGGFRIVRHGDHYDIVRQGCFGPIVIHGGRFGFPPVHGR